jgi:hypothetical protein
MLYFLAFSGTIQDTFSDTNHINPGLALVLKLPVYLVQCKNMARILNPLFPSLCKQTEIKSRLLTSVRIY